MLIPGFLRTRIQFFFVDWSRAIPTQSRIASNGPELTLSASLLVKNRMKLVLGMMAVSGNGSLSLGDAAGGNTELDFADLWVTSGSRSIVLVYRNGKIDFRSLLVRRYLSSSI